MAEPSEDVIRPTRTPRAAAAKAQVKVETEAEEEEEGTKGRKGKKKGKKRAKEATAATQDDPPSDYDNVDNDGRCDGCTTEGVVCAFLIEKLIAWRTNEDAPKPVCWRCKCRRKGCSFERGAAKARTAEKTKGKQRATSPVPSATSSLKRKRATQVVVELPVKKKTKTEESEIGEWGRKIERKLEGILQAIKAGTDEQKERDRALVAWLARVSGETAPTFVEGSSRLVAPILTPAGSSRLAEEESMVDQEIEIEVEDIRAEKEVGADVLRKGSDEKSGEGSEEEDD
jgi:hypothetical protein